MILRNGLEAVRARVDFRLMPGDHMLAGNLEQYSSVGASALEIVHSNILLANSCEPKAILDFGCGSGRVLRWLRASFPDADIYASDVRVDSLHFCAEAFLVKTWLSSASISELSSPAKYDLIWCGSVLTHLSEEKSRALLRKFYSWLNIDGICIVTTHGRKVLENIKSGRNSYVQEKRHKEVLFGLVETGYGFLPFSGTEVGFSVSSMEWLIREVKQCGARIVSFSEQVWSRHHDVLAFQRLE